MKRFAAITWLLSIVALVAAVPTADAGLINQSGARHFSQAATNWADVEVNFANLGAELATSGRKVRLSLTGGDYGARVDTVNGATLTELPTGAYDGTMAIRLTPQTGSANNANNTYVGIANGADLWNGGATDVAQVNLGFCIYWGARYIDLAATTKLTGVIGSQSLGGSVSASASRAAVFEVVYSGTRIFSITATTLTSYHQPTSGFFPEDGPDANKLVMLGTTINHANDPPLVGQEWLYFEQEVDYRRDRGNADGRNRLDVWSRSGYLGYMEIPLTWRSDWDFTYLYAAYVEYIGGLFNNPSTANANNYFIISHPIFSVNRAKDARIGPPPGFVQNLFLPLLIVGGRRRRRAIGWRKRALLALSLLGLAATVHAAVTAVGTPSSNAGNSTTPSTAHTVASGTDVSYICVFGGGDATISAINSFGGVTPQLVGDYANALHLYRVVSPSAGATTAQATLSTSTVWSIHVMDLDGVDTTDPDDAPVTNTTSEVAEVPATVTSATGDLVAACGIVVYNDVAASSGATLSTEEEAIDGGFISSALVYEAGATSVTLGISASSASFGDNQLIATNVNAAAGGGASGLLLRRRRN